MHADPAAPPADHAGARTVWRRVRDVWAGDDRRADAATAVLTFVVGVTLLQVGLVGIVRWDGIDGVPPPQPWWRVALLAVGCALMLVKRRHPMWTLAGGLVVTAVDLRWGGSLAILLVLWDLLYGAALRSGPRARAWLWATTVTVSVVGAVAAGEAARELRAFVSMGLNLGAVLLIPLWWAANVRAKTELADLERARADEAARAAELERERATDLATITELDRHEAVQAERAAMARDLHDVIASHLSTIAIHSGAALAVAPDAGRDRAALEQVRTSAVASLTEMRSMIGLLRADAPRDPFAAPSRLDRLDDLVAGARDAGLDVRVDDPGNAAARPLPAAVGQALHRIAQEALTNARKHAPGAPVVVGLRYDGGDGGDGDGDGTVTLTIRNAAPTGGASPAAGEPALSAGTGLLTMRERAEGVGGTLDVGPEPAGGWVVRAVVPGAPRPTGRVAG